MEQSDKCYGGVEEGGVTNSVYLGGMLTKEMIFVLTPCLQGKEKLF